MKAACIVVVANYLDWFPSCCWRWWYISSGGFWNENSPTGDTFLFYLLLHFIFKPGGWPVLHYLGTKIKGPEYIILPHFI
jgi:hypothetical protein